MRNFITALVLLATSTVSIAQVSQIDLAQTPGEFTTTSLDLEAGDYQFNISNTDVEGQVGFVIVPAGKYAPENHIQAAYVKAPVDQGKSSMTNVVKLAAGEYEYFCPLNNTPKYKLVVHDNVETIRLNQKPGAFDKKSVSVKEGVYKFEIHNDGVDHEVGFVLVPAGKYTPADHIKAAYVKAPVPTGQSSETNLVDLAAGSYEYFCPLNPTEKYALTVSK
jgi:plastocyanin